MTLQLEQPGHLARPTEPARRLTMYCQADPGDGAIHVPSAALQELDPELYTELFLYSGTPAEVTAGDWSVYVGILDMIWLLEVELE